MGSSTPEARSCDDFDVRIEASFSLGYGFYDDTPYDDLKKVIDPSSPLVVTPSLEFITVSDAHEGSLTVDDSSIPLASLKEPKKGVDLRLMLSLMIIVAYLI